ncbi:MAG: YbaB/EbfC family nucleoid-associated protein [Christensenellales bacterium]|jgi:DNA-binding YbaB/EbfC family protein
MANFKGGFGGFGGANLQQLMKQAQKMQADMEQAKEALANTEFKGVAGGGMVEVVLTGDKKLKKVNLKPEVVDPDDIEMLEDLLVASFNDAINKIEQVEKQTMPSIPGM